jgi:hypothetical protein
MTSTETTPHLTESLAACTDAMDTLNRLGRLDDANDALTKAASTDYDLNEVEGRTDEWKVNETAKRYAATVTTLSRQLQSAAARATTSDRMDAQTVFGSRGIAGDRTAVEASLRQASADAAKITDARQRNTAMSEALRKGDHVMSRALVEAAVNNGDVDSTNTYIAAHPHLDATVNRLWAARQQANATLPLKTAFTLGALKPQALSSLDDWRIAERASTPNV